MRPERHCFIAGRRWLGAVVGLVCIGTVVTPAAEPIKVEGAGWLQDRRIERALRELEGSAPSEWISANDVEDAAFFTISTLAENGFLAPTVTATIERAEADTLVHAFDETFTELLPRPLRGERARLVVERGVRYTFGDVDVMGLPSEMEAAEAVALVVPDSGLLSLASERVFTTGQLRSGLGQIERTLESRGFAEARVWVEDETRDTESGVVTLAVRVDPGPRWQVVAIEQDAAAEGVAEPPPPEVNRPWNPGWEQDLAERRRRAYYEAGYPDARVTVEAEPGEVIAAKGPERPVTLRVSVIPGERVRVGEVRFRGDENLSGGLLQRQVRLQAGEWLNPLEVDRARRRLGRLRALSRVDLRYEPANGEERSPVFSLQEREPWESSLLFGYGSFEHVRGGVEVRGYNLLRRSHHVRIEAVGSLKSLRGDLVYTVPDIFGETMDAHLRLFGLDREELAFQRREYGATLSLTRREVPWLKADATLSYTFQDLASSENELGTRSTDLTRTTTGSIGLALARDQRDNPLNPRKGRRWFTQFEAADPTWGGEVGYQRLEAGVAWHKPWGEDRWVHAGVRLGGVLTLGQPNDRNLPVNKRFFPGGENSYRGLQNGEAAPRNAAGEFIGAKSYALINLEIEQALTRRLSAVVFWDALGAAAELASFPFAYDLHAVGVGLRYKTIIGPVRLEYGHNLNPRADDPDGTLHFSLGYPF